MRNSFDKGQQAWTNGSKAAAARSAKGTGGVRRKAAGTSKQMSSTGKQLHYRASKNGSALKERSQDKDKQCSAQKRRSNQSSVEKCGGAPNAKERRQRAQFEVYHRQNSQKTDHNNFVNNVQYESDGEDYGAKPAPQK